MSEKRTFKMLRDGSGPVYAEKLEKRFAAILANQGIAIEEAFDGDLSNAAVPHTAFLHKRLERIAKVSHCNNINVALYIDELDMNLHLFPYALK